jgi:hypothetical protein
MTRPSQIRQIVAELRRALGPEPAAWELLRLAALIVESHREPGGFGFEFDERAGRRPFFALAVDMAFQQDDGWKVVDFESRQGMIFGDDIDDNRYQTQSRLRGFFGRTVWPRIGTD